MQTFVPYGSDFAANATVLDRQRLGKQRVEGFQILRSLLGVSTGWRNHPATKMWQGHEWSLSAYVIAICDEWTSRGYADSVAGKIEQTLSDHPDIDPTSGHPEWLDFRPLVLSHRSNLVRKLPEHYRQYWPKIDSNLPYVWPV